jgi:hypothetical protein
MGFMYILKRPGSHNLEELAMYWFTVLSTIGLAVLNLSKYYMAWFAVSLFFIPLFTLFSTWLSFGVWGTAKFFLRTLILFPFFCRYSFFVSIVDIS